MQLTTDQKSVILRVVNAFETGSADGDYGDITILADGPHDIRQITYGRSQTTEYGNLRTLIRMYADAEGIHSAALKSYVDKIGAVPLVDDAAFRQLLQSAGRKDPVMRTIQDRFFDDAYFNPAMAWAGDHGFTFPLSALVIYDSYIHSGSILWLIRRMFSENPPNRGGDEKSWIKAYLTARKNWLANHRNPAVRDSVYRVKDLLRETARDNWNLAQLPILANGVRISAHVS